MIEQLVLRDACGNISAVVERALSPAETAAAATWARIRRDVLPAVAPPPDGRARITFPVRIDPPELAEPFGRELLCLARLDAGAWSAWSAIGFTINGGPPLDLSPRRSPRGAAHQPELSQAGAGRLAVVGSTTSYSDVFQLLISNSTAQVSGSVQIGSLKPQ